MDEENTAKGGFAESMKHKTIETWLASSSRQRGGMLFRAFRTVSEHALRRFQGSARLSFSLALFK